MELALELPDGSLVPVWSADHARELNVRSYGGWGEVLIENLVIDMHHNSVK